MYEDKIIKKVRAVKEKIAKECHFDANILSAMLKKEKIEAQKLGFKFLCLKDIK